MPLVDWGARFEAIRLPVRLRVDLRTVDRQTVQRSRRPARSTSSACAAQARDAIAGYLKALIGVTMLARARRSGCWSRSRSAAAPGRGCAGRRARGSRRRSGSASRSSCCCRRAARSTSPQYYAHGADIPRALEAIDTPSAPRACSTRSSTPSSSASRGWSPSPPARAPLAGAPRLTVASDLHNNVLDDPDPRALGRRRPGAVPRRPDRPRLAAGGPRRAAGRAHRAAVRVRLGQPRLRHARARARPARARSC